MKLPEQVNNGETRKARLTRLVDRDWKSCVHLDLFRALTGQICGLPADLFTRMPQRP